MESSNSCNRVSNNKYFSCPPLMNDGRQFTDYSPKCVQNYNLTVEKPMSSYELRQYLIKNASNIIQESRKNTYDNSVCGPCQSPYKTSSMMLEKDVQQCNPNFCDFAPFDDKGLGITRNYNVPEPHTLSQGSCNQAYLAFLEHKENEQFDENVCVKPVDLLQHQTINKVHKHNSRSAIPSGGDVLVN